MLTKTQLQQEVQNLEAKLQQFREQLNTYKETPTIQEAMVGDTLGDGSIVLQKSDGLALLVSPASTEVKAPWTKEFPLVFQKLKEEGFPLVFQKLKEEGFNPSQWFVPSIEQLKLAYENIPNEFSPTFYWSSTEGTSRGACPMNFNNGTPNCYLKTFTLYIRAFRYVTY